ncbi:MAG TPA: cohesin domain-containing protein [Patescibacteria group bacterium]|nr:cohesin domain-containing protein [Patescibacteria group bacterium]
MTITEKLFKAWLVSCLFFVVGLFSATSVSAVSRLYFEPPASSPVQNVNFSIDVNIDVGSESIFGADAVIRYPASDLSLQSVSYGGYFPDTVTPIQNSGEVIIRGSFFSSATGSGAGSGKFATLTFKSNKNSGTGNINFLCSGFDTDIIDIAGDNILSCTSINQVALTYTGAGTATTPPPNNEDTTAPTNACGGSCGSVYNCNAGLFCYGGFCRNPDCKDDISCSCKATPLPTPTKKPASKFTPKPGVPGTSPTPVVVTLAQYTPPPTFIPEESPLPEIAEAKRSIDVKTAGIVVGAIVLLVALIMFIASRIRSKNPPKITPPTGPGFDNPPPAPPMPTTF